MISKKKAFIYSIVLVILTVMLTNVVQLTFGKQVMVPKEVYEGYKEYSKLFGLQSIVEEDFYKKTDKEDLVTGAIKGMFEGLDDPYSQYYTVEEFNKLKEQTSGTYVGIGVVISPDEENLITVVSPIEGSPAQKSGIKSGDKIIKVDGKAVTGKDIDAAMGMIKGKKGTEVTITIKRDKENIDFKIKRQEIKMETVKSEVLEDNVGYIKITSFDETTGEDFKVALENLKSKNIEGLILDLRDNPGGLLNICKDIADELIGEGTIVEVKDNKGKSEKLTSDKGSLGLPISVLINGGSASASEILTGAIVDNKAGIAVGTTTFGKGLVQSVRELKDGTGYKLTTAQYFTPSGEYIHEKGIDPNIEEDDESKQLDVALDWIKKEINK